MDPVLPASLAQSIAPQPVSAVTPIQKSKYRIFVWIIVGIIILGIGITSGLFLGKKLYPTLQITPTLTPDPTAKWGGASEITKETAIILVKRSFPEVKNVEETPNVTIGKSMDIRAEQESGSWRVLFWQGSGDCPSGCLNDHEWYFIVKNDGSVEKVGEFERVYNSRKNGYDEKGVRVPGFWNE